jgi:uncharacterized membrane protein
MMTGHKLWVGASAIVLLTLTATLVDVSGFIRGAAALLFVLLLPGWAITAALLPERVFGFWERLAISVGSSIAIAMLTGLLLHLTPWGIQTGVWWSLMAGITLIAGLVALGRLRTRLTIPGVRLNRAQVAQVGLIGLALLVSSLAVIIARQPSPPQGFEGYTSLWIFPFRYEGDHAIQVGVSSQEFDDVAYRLELQWNGQVIKEYPPFNLSPGESMDVILQFEGDFLAAGGAIQAMLYRMEDQEQVYRQVTWWPADDLD